MLLWVSDSLGSEDRVRVTTLETASLKTSKQWLLPYFSPDRFLLKIAENAKLFLSESTALPVYLTASEDCESNGPHLC